MANLVLMFNQWLKRRKRGLPSTIMFSCGDRRRIKFETSEGIRFFDSIEMCGVWRYDFMPWEMLLRTGIEEPWKSEVKARLEEAKIREDLEKSNG